MVNSCDCHGCGLLGDGACGYKHCNTCGGDFDEALHCTDEETNRHACPKCLLEGIETAVTS